MIQGVMYLCPSKWSIKSFNIFIKSSAVFHMQVFMGFKSYNDHLQGIQNQDAMPNICPMPYHAFVFVKSSSFACHNSCQACLPCHHQAFSLCHVIFPRSCPSCPLFSMVVMLSLQPLSLMCCYQ